MKRLLILLFIPTLSYSQITYEDIMSINSEKIFKKVMIENGCVFDSVGEKGVIIYSSDDKISYYSFFPEDNTWLFMLSKTDLLGLVLGVDLNDSKSSYDLIFDSVKDKCVYYDIINVIDVDFVCYNCSGSTDSIKVGFTSMDNYGMIKSFPKE